VNVSCKAHKQKQTANTNLEEAHSFDHVILVKSEPMVDASGENQEITRV
jgi:hypothetical protein